MIIPETSGDCRQEQDDHRGIPHALAVGVVKDDYVRTALDTIEERLLVH